MASPFPGMDPYLEDPLVWATFHTPFVVAISDALNVQLPSRYVADIGERLYIVRPERSIYTVVALTKQLELQGGLAGSTEPPGIALAIDPAWEATVYPERIREAFVEIKLLGKPARVVTVFEVLSPSNKASGNPGQLYRNKQKELLGSQISLMEIDLLRRGRHTLAAPRALLDSKVAWNYVVCLHRVGRRGHFQWWQRTVRQRLPRVCVPLADGDADIVIDIQEVFSHCYDKGVFNRKFDYSLKPGITLSKGDAAWADELLRERGLRPRRNELDSDWRNRYEVGIEAARLAGRLALGYFERALNVEWKLDSSPVTVADREAEALLRTRLLKAFPQDGFLGEESGEVHGTSGFRWIIDPIDGTRSFVRGIPIWGTLVGLEYKGEQIAGVADVPAMDMTYRAMRGDGAYRGDRKIHVSDIAELNKAQMFYSTLAWFVKAGCKDMFLDLVVRTQRQRGFGDFYGFMLVAQGSGELMVEHGVHAWDVAALRPIIEEAGGRFSNWDGGAAIDRPDVLVSNGKVHEAALELLRGADQVKNVQNV